MSDNFPPDWAIELALVEPNRYIDPEYGTLWNVEWVKRAKDVAWAVSVLSHARLIAQHTPEPIDPDLLIAREACAQVNDENDYLEFARSVRDGSEDDYTEVKIALRAIKLYKEKNE